MEVLIILACAALGATLGELVCRSGILHRRRSVRLLGGFAYACLIGTTIVVATPNIARGSVAEFEPWLLSLLVLGIGAAFGPLRRFFAYAMVPFEHGERVRIGQTEGWVQYYRWTGLELCTHTGVVMIPVLSLYDVIITRYPRTQSD